MAKEGECELQESSAGAVSDLPRRQQPADSPLRPSTHERSEDDPKRLGLLDESKDAPDTQNA